jgi:Flp pilus assembly protein TadB
MLSAYGFAMFCLGFIGLQASLVLHIAQSSSATSAANEDRAMGTTAIIALVFMVSFLLTLAVTMYLFDRRQFRGLIEAADLASSLVFHSGSIPSGARVHRAVAARQTTAPCPLKMHMRHVTQQPVQ